MQRDRDEWKTQHENLLAMYQCSAALERQLAAANGEIALLRGAIIRAGHCLDGRYRAPDVARARARAELVRFIPRDHITDDEADLLNSTSPGTPPADGQ